MPSLSETEPRPWPPQRQLERLAIARRLMKPDGAEADLAEPHFAAPARTVSGSQSLRSPDDDASPDGSRSALSAPENFIAEGPVSAFFHRHWGRRRWPVVLAVVVIAGAAAAYVGLSGSRLVPRSVLVAKSTPRGGADLSGTPSANSPTAEAHTTDAAASPPLRKDPPVEPVEPATGSSFQRRLATAGLSEPDANAIGTTDARVTAFPPSAAVEPEPLPAVPPPAEPPVTQTHDAAAVETASTKASPPHSNPKLDALVGRAEQLLAAGDVIKARQFFGRIAADGDPRGALGMARSYDEQVLRTLPAGDRAAKADQAKWWYEKARTLDAAEHTDAGGRADPAR